MTSLPEGLTGQATPFGSEKAGGTARSGRSGGAVASGFEPVRQQFDSFLREDSSYSAQLVVHVGDDVVVDLWGGPVLGQTSITGVYSVSKGITALVIALLIQDGTLALEEPVASWWPEFGVHGKQTVTVRQLLTHQAALINAVPTLTPEQFLDPRVAAARLADTIPVWRPGAAFGYHALTIGPLVEELVRRAAGHSLQHLWNQRVRKPHEVDFFLGLPASEDQRYVALQPTTSATSVEPPDAGGLPEHALGLSEPFSPNLRLVRAGGSASIGAVGSARGLAQAYASVITSSSPLLDSTTLATVSQLQVDGHDLVLDQHMRFGVFFMKPRPASLWGGWRAIGHDGAAGALGFADPDHRIALGYIPNPAPERGGADPRAVALSATVRECVRAQAQSAQVMRAATSAEAARAAQKLHKRPQIG